MSDIWSKIDRSLVNEPDPATATTQGVAAAPTSHGNLHRFKLFSWLDLIALLCWAYALTKIFLFDFDAYLVQHWFPAAAWLVDYRFVVVLVALAIAAVAVRRIAFVGWIAYIGFFPVILLAWKMPLAIHRTRSWVVLFAATNVLVDLVRDYRYALVTAAIGIVSAIVVLTTSLHWLLAIAAAAMFLLLVVAYLRTTWRAINPPRFITSQIVVLDRIMGSEGFDGLWKAKPELKDPQVEKFNAAQQAAFLQSAAYGIFAHQLLYWWAYQLDRYSKSAVLYLSNGYAYIALFIQSVVVFAFVNYAISRIDSNAFHAGRSLRPFDFIHYSINSLFGSPVDYLTPQSDVALLTSDVARITGIFVLFTFVAAVIFSYRQTRQEEALRNAIAKFKQRGREFDVRFREQYDISVAEGFERLRELHYVLLRVMVFFSSRVPTDFGERP